MMHRPSHRTGTARRGRAGFSLLEVLLAIAVLGAGLAMLMAVFAETGEAGARIRVRDDLQLLAEMRMAQIEAGEIDPGLHPGESGFDRKPGYFWSVRLAEIEPFGRLQQVDLTVRYEGIGGERSVTLTRLRALPDEQRILADPTIATLPVGLPAPRPPTIRTPFGIKPEVKGKGAGGKGGGKGGGGFGKGGGGSGKGGGGTGGGGTGGGGTGGGGAGGGGTGGGMGGGGQSMKGGR